MKHFIKETIAGIMFSLGIFATFILMMNIHAFAAELPSDPIGFNGPNCILECPLPEEQQVYLNNLCVEYGIDKSLALATIEFESQWNPNAFNGHDRGLCQVNKCWIKSFKKMGWITCAEDLFDPIVNIKCGMHILGDAVRLYGNTERAYAFYNTGNPKIKSNANSRIVWKRAEYWREVIDSINN